MTTYMSTPGLVLLLGCWYSMIVSPAVTLEPGMLVTSQPSAPVLASTRTRLCSLLRLAVGQLI